MFKRVVATLAILALLAVPALAAKKHQLEVLDPTTRTPIASVKACEPFLVVGSEFEVDRFAYVVFTPGELESSQVIGEDTKDKFGEFEQVRFSCELGTLDINVYSRKNGPPGKPVPSVLRAQKEVLVTP